MNPNLAQLHPYPFEKLARLFSDLKPSPALPNIALSIGEPRHASPDFVKQALVDNLKHLSTYPTTKGMPGLREAIADWLKRRFHLSEIDFDRHVLPVNGTREAIFSFVQAVVTPAETGQPQPIIVMPNPFYQIYEGAAFLAGATPYFVNCTAENGYLGDWDAIPADVWAQTQLVFICTPGNPTGAVMPAEQLKKLIALSDEYGFVIASDECYSELYFDTAPVGLLEVCASIGRHDYRNCVVFHSLSKRSNLPGLRSGFIAGDAALLAPYLLYRTYHGSAMPAQHQLASIAAWQDEAHVEANRVLYRQKFELFVSELGDKFAFKKPDAGFYFWLPVDDDEAFARRLYGEQHITVLPGRYLSREANGVNPGVGHVRMALVADMAQCEIAVERFKALT
jgi:N-succinyldiaminopimelate aminotransferase